jgi:pimeloyl-ACP methyl ester carboxylesterase
MSATSAYRERMLRTAPVRERRTRLAGATTAILEGGDGPPLVLLHGGIECGAAIWAPILSGLAASHRVVAPDLPGLGESEPLDRLDAPGFSEWFARLLRETCTEPPTVIAHSLGGTLLARFASERAAALRRVLICAAPGVGPYRMPLKLRVVAVRFALRPTARNGERFERLALLDRERTRARDAEWFDAFSGYNRARAATPHVKRTMRQLVSECTKQIPEQELRRIEASTALVWGRGDRMVPLSIGEGASRQFGWPLHEIEGAAHAPQIEQPEAFLAVFR